MCDELKGCLHSRVGELVVYRINEHGEGCDIVLSLFLTVCVQLFTVLSHQTHWHATVH